MVSLWGVGFENRKYTLENIKELINFFKNDPKYGNCVVLLGVSSILTWKLIKENEEIRLYFYQEYSLFNETKKNTVFYTITSIQTDSMKLIGNNPDGHQLNLDMIKEQ